jgi:hypothetical protein
MTDLPAGVQPFRSASQARKRVTRRLFDYWQSTLEDGVPPPRTGIDPAAIKDILPFILLGDIEPEPFRVLFRLVGTTIVEFSHQDFTGQYLDQLVYSARDSVEWRRCYRYLHAHRVALIGDNQLTFIDGRVTTYEFAILPLRRGDDPAGSFIAAEAYEGFDRLDIKQITPVTRGA